jgi:DNA-directed RNA polymerase specialized sigma24 family protein
VTSAPLPVRREARRQIVNVLRVTASIATYSAAALANGLNPEQAQQAALDTATELERTAAVLRRLAAGRLTTAERRRLVAELAVPGMSQRRIAELVGVTQWTVWNDLHGR